MKFQKFKIGDEVYIKNKSVGKSLIEFLDRNSIEEKFSLTKTKFRISNYSSDTKFYVIRGDWFLEEDLRISGNEQLKLF